jgi:hypothetical protein
MQSRSRRSAVLALLILFAAVLPVWAGANLNEVGALLVYPLIVGSAGQETLVTVTNAGPSAVVAHVAYINGDPTPIQQGGAGYCYECDFDLPLSGSDTETLVITDTATGIAIEAEDLNLSLSCPFPYGMIVISLEDLSGNVLTENVLFGEEVVIDYGLGTAYSIPAIPFQGGNGGNSDRSFRFDDQEYAKFPRVVAADFLAPDLEPGGVTADLALFTLNFDRQFPPLVDCSVTGYDADEHPFSSSFQMGCWGMIGLCEVSPEFCYPNLGLFGNLDTHGWLLLNCRVDRDANGTFDANGGVHGAILQTASSGADIRRNTPGAGTMSTTDAWARLLAQSVTTGDSVTLLLGGGAGTPGLD